jgi:hypothetical protein
MTWPPQSPNINTIETVLDELDCRVKEKQPTSAQHIYVNPFKTVGKTFLMELVEIMPSVSSR